MTKRKPAPPRRNRARQRPRGGAGGSPAPGAKSKTSGRGVESPQSGATSARAAAKKARPQGRGGGAKSAGFWLYGSHAVLAALANPRRRCHRLLLTGEAARHHEPALAEALRQRAPALAAEKAGREEIESLLPEGAVHQGLALQVEPLPALALEDLISLDAEAGRPVVLALDQVTDPRNVGAILRSAAAFGARGVIAPARHTAPPGGALAKAASGALETLPYIEVSNLARALDKLKAAGFWCLGLAGEAQATLAEADGGGPLVLVLGAEGKGLRRLTRETCDTLARLPTEEPIASLNVSNAAAVALYQVLRG